QYMLHFRTEDDMFLHLDLPDYKNLPVKDACLLTLEEALRVQDYPFHVKHQRATCSNQERAEVSEDDDLAPTQAVSPGSRHAPAMPFMQDDTQGHFPFGLVAATPPQQASQGHNCRQKTQPVLGQAHQSSSDDNQPPGSLDSYQQFDSGDNNEQRAPSVASVLSITDSMLKPSSQWDWEAEATFLEGQLGDLQNSLLHYRTELFDLKKVVSELQQKLAENKFLFVYT
ncbi:hypothetical protein MBANPS3_011363, partial [Mucor bainieri]